MAAGVFYGAVRDTGDRLGQSTPVQAEESNEEERGIHMRMVSVRLVTPTNRRY